MSKKDEKTKKPIEENPPKDPPAPPEEEIEDSEEVEEDLFPEPEPLKKKAKAKNSDLLVTAFKEMKAELKTMREDMEKILNPTKPEPKEPPAPAKEYRLFDEFDPTL